MIKAKTIIFCENIIRDIDGDRISAINIFDNIGAQSFPVFLSSFCILTISQRDVTDKSKWDLIFNIKLDKLKLFEDKLVIDYQDKPQNRSIIRIHGFAIPRPGILKVTIKAGRKKVADHSIDVIQSGPPKIEKK